jgi:two-component system, OmpR family, response regulator
METISNISGIEVILVEDDLILRESISEYLSLSGIMVTEAGSSMEFYARLSSRMFSVAVVDVSLPDQSGLVIAEYLRANTDTGVILLTARETVEDRVAGYAAGADIYLVKPVDSRELLAAIISLSQRRKHSAAAQQTRNSSLQTWTLDRCAWQLRPPMSPPVPLTAKELSFLELLAASPGMTITRDKLLDSIYGRHDDYTSRALDSMVRRLRHKISGIAPQQSPIKTTHAVGYSFSSQLTVLPGMAGQGYDQVDK